MLTTSQVQNFAVSTLEIKDYTTNREENKTKNLNQPEEIHQRNRIAIQHYVSIRNLRIGRELTYFIPHF